MEEAASAVPSVFRAERTRTEPGNCSRGRETFQRQSEGSHEGWRKPSWSVAGGTNEQINGDSRLGIGPSQVIR